MKKILLPLILGLALNSMAADAQSRFRWGLGYGYTMAGKVTDKFSNGTGRTIYGEFRIKQDDSRFDFGLQASGTIIVREIGFRSCNFMGVSDYNIHIKNEAEVFFGLGAGIMFCEDNAGLEPLGSFYYASDDPTSATMCIMPRGGVEIGNLMRLSAYYLFEEPANKHFGLTVGVTFGKKR